MTNYNDGNWHGWNGGECPVHPNTRIKGIEENRLQWEADAEDCDWHSFRGAFRVVKEHREPIQFWLGPVGDGLWEFSRKHAPGARLFREVIE